MSRKYLVIESVGDSLRHGPMLTVGVAVLEDRNVKVVEGVKIDEQTAKSIKDAIAKHAEKIE